MKKKEMLKEQKRLKNDRKILQSSIGGDVQAKNGLFIALGVIGFISITFLVMNILKGDINLFTKGNNIQHDIDPRMVLCGTMFDKTDEEYYVLAYDLNNDDHEIYAALNEKYSSKTIYTLDMGSGFNKECISDKKVINNDISKLKINEPILLKIKKGKIVNNYTGSKKIDEILSK